VVHPSTLMGLGRSEINRSSMTLFDFVAPGEGFGQVLQKFFEGRTDQASLAALTRASAHKVRNV
jgi:uncharacterized protein (DUF1810 family)